MALLFVTGPWLPGGEAHSYLDGARLRPARLHAEVWRGPRGSALFPDETANPVSGAVVEVPEDRLAVLDLVATGGGVPCKRKQVRAWVGLKGVTAEAWVIDPKKAAAAGFRRPGGLPIVASGPPTRPIGAPVAKVAPKAAVKAAPKGAVSPKSVAVAKPAASAKPAVPAKAAPKKVAAKAVAKPKKKVAKPAVKAGKRALPKAAAVARKGKRPAPKKAVPKKPAPKKGAAKKGGKGKRRR